MLKQNKDIKNDFELIFPNVSEKLSKLKDKTVLITGGTGFIGCWLSELIYYLNDSHNMNIKLIIVARDYDSLKSKLPHLVDSKFLHFIHSDIRDLTEVSKEVNYIIHAANSPDNRFHSSRPFERMTTVAEGMGSLMRAASFAPNLLKIINLSSSRVYSLGKVNKENFIEEDQGFSFEHKLFSCFGESMRYSELLGLAARNEFRLPIVNIRPFTFCGAYGSIESPWALNNFINDALSDRPISILGDGSAVRSYMYGADLAAWIFVITLHSEDGKTYNVGNDQGFSIFEIAKKVANFFQPAPSVLLNTSLAPKVNNFSLLPDISNAKNDFGLSHYTDVETAIERSVEWHKENLNSKS